MLSEPGVEVKSVIDETPPHPDLWQAEAGQGRNADAQIISGLLPGKAAFCRQRKVVMITAADVIGVVHRKACGGAPAVGCCRTLGGLLIVAAGAPWLTLSAHGVG